MLRKLILLALTSGLAARAWRHWHGREARRRAAEAERAAIRTWETEGGAPRA